MTTSVWAKIALVSAALFLCINCTYTRRVHDEDRGFSMTKNDGDKRNEGHTGIQYSSVAEMDLMPSASGHGHNNGKYNTGFQFNKDVKGKKGFKDILGYHRDHHGSHGKSKYAGYKDQAGKKYKGGKHKSKYSGDVLKGVQGKKGHRKGSKGHHNKGHKDKGFKNVYHKEEYHHSKKFYDDFDNKKYNNKYNDLDAYLLSNKAKKFKGKNYKSPDFQTEKTKGREARNLKAFSPPSPPDLKRYKRTERDIAYKRIHREREAKTSRLPKAFSVYQEMDFADFCTKLRSVGHRRKCQRLQLRIEKNGVGQNEEELIVGFMERLIREKEKEDMEKELREIRPRLKRQAIYYEMEAGGYHLDKHGKKGQYTKGQFHDNEHKHQDKYGHKGFYDAENSHGKKAAHKKTHGHYDTGHGGHDKGHPHGYSGHSSGNYHSGHEHGHGGHEHGHGGHEHGHGGHGYGHGGHGSGNHDFDHSDHTHNSHGHGTYGHHDYGQKSHGHHGYGHDFHTDDGYPIHTHDHNHVVGFHHGSYGAHSQQQPVPAGETTSSAGNDINKMPSTKLLAPPPLIPLPAQRPIPTIQPYSQPPIYSPSLSSELPLYNLSSHKPLYPSAPSSFLSTSASVDPENSQLDSVSNVINMPEIPDSPQISTKNLMPNFETFGDFAKIADS